MDPRQYFTLTAIPFEDTDTELLQCPRPRQRFEWEIYLRGKEIHRVF